MSHAGETGAKFLAENDLPLIHGTEEFIHNGVIVILSGGDTIIFVFLSTTTTTPTRQPHVPQSRVFAATLNKVGRSVVLPSGRNRNANRKEMLSARIERLVECR